MAKYVTIHSNDRVTPRTTVTVLLSIGMGSAAPK